MTGMHHTPEMGGDRMRALMLAAVLLLGLPAAAHQLGGYATNQFFWVDLTTEPPKLVYRIELGEIESFKELEKMDTDGDLEVGEGESDAYLDVLLPELGQNLHVTVDSEERPLTLVDTGLSLRYGMGGMHEATIQGIFAVGGEGGLPAGPFEIEVWSKNFEGVLGLFILKAMLGEAFVPGETESYATLPYDVSVGADGNPLYQNTAPQFRLPIVPVGAVSADGAEPVLAAQTGEAPPAETHAEETYDAPMEIASAADDEADRRADPGGMLTRLLNLLRSEHLPWTVMLLGMGIALVLGMGHAFSPGHGKAVMAAYLVGERGTYGHAIALGLVVTITHTWSVFLLGLVTLSAGARMSEERVTFWTGIASGGIIVAIGLVLFLRRYQQFVLARAGLDAHDHDHHHHHTHDHEHAHEKQAPGYGSILWLGVSGGIVPCPSALVVLLLAVKFERLAYGLGLILVFSTGLALVLVAIGLLVVRGSGFVRATLGERSALLTALPVLSSVLITGLGGAIVFWTLVQHGVVTIQGG